MLLLHYPVGSGSNWSIMFLPRPSISTNFFCTFWMQDFQLSEIKFQLRIFPLRAPSYKLIGGRMVESMFQDRSSFGKDFETLIMDFLASSSTDPCLSFSVWVWFRLNLVDIQILANPSFACTNLMISRGCFCLFAAWFVEQSLNGSSRFFASKACSRPVCLPWDVLMFQNTREREGGRETKVYLFQDTHSD